MSLKISMLEVAVKMLTSGDIYRMISQMVKNAQNTTMTSAEKKDAVMTEARLFIRKYSTTVLNILIEVAVLALKGRIDNAR